MQGRKFPREAEQSGGLLKIGAPIDLGRRHIAPIVATFTARHPALEAHLVKTSAIRHLHDCSDCLRLERLPGETCTYWQAPPLRDAHQKRSLRFSPLHRPPFVPERQQGAALGGLKFAAGISG
jgi:DNA-binding transcriptional LysR family regulator